MTLADVSDWIIVVWAGYHVLNWIARIIKAFFQE